MNYNPLAEYDDTPDEPPEVLPDTDDDRAADIEDRKTRQTEEMWERLGW